MNYISEDWTYFLYANHKSQIFYFKIHLIKITHTFTYFYMCRIFTSSLLQHLMFPIFFHCLPFALFLSAVKHCPLLAVTKRLASWAIFLVLRPLFFFVSLPWLDLTAPLVLPLDNLVLEAGIQVLALDDY